VSGTAGAVGGAARRQEFMAPGSPEPFSHYVDAVRADGLLFVSGCVPIDGEGRLVGGDDVQEQARQVFRNIGAILAEAGAGFTDVVKVTLFLTHIEDRAAINVVRKEVFGDVRPASTLIEISRLLVPGARLEVEAVALLP
jgi:2-iminobutanoate/2-iminopropanoate deaminase